MNARKLHAFLILAAEVATGFMFTDTCVCQSGDIEMNQLGFYPAMPKVAVVRNAGPGPFYVVSGTSGDTAYRGTLTSQQTWSYSGQSVSRADFSTLSTPGSYTIAVPGVGSSMTFEIKDRIHGALAAASLKSYYFQRASTALPAAYAGIWSRSEGHPDTVVYVHPSAATPLRPAGTVIASPRGWYDAGDYNKYIVNSGISTYTILATYEHFPLYCGALKTNIPESSNSIPDILDEALWNIQWMLTMQDPYDGGVYHKLTNPNFDGWVMPAQATNPRYVVLKSTAATLDFAAVMAQASRIFRDFGTELPGFADSCLQASFRAWNWARKNPSLPYNQTQLNQQYPANTINTGEYGDGYFQDEFDWAAAELYVTTKQDSFLTIANPVNYSATVPSWPDVRTLGLYSLAHYRKTLTPAADTTAIKNRILTLAGSLLSSKNASAYNIVMGAQSYDFVWGSNGVAANQGMALLCAYQLTGDTSYLNGALSNLDYMLGRNATTYCFVTGFGTHSPMSIHHRPSQSDGVTAPVPGLLVGGPNPGQQDGVNTYPSSMPGLSYTDNYEAYACNEICINWNAPLVFLAVGMEGINSPNGLPTGVQPKATPGTVPHKYGLIQNYPNPFNPSTTIEYVLPRDGRVVLRIYNLLGQEVGTLLDGWVSRGTHQLSFAPSDLPSGVYICRLAAGGTVTSSKMVLTK